MGYFFGVSKCFVLPLNSSQAVEIGTLTDVKLDFSYTMKELRGQYSDPLCIMQSQRTIKGSANFAEFNGDVITALLHGTPVYNEVKLLGKDDVKTIPETSSYTVTVDHAADFTQDGGVTLIGSEALYNTKMKRVATPSATGEYSESAGVYTFDVADKGKRVRIDYEYSSVSGTTYKLPNLVMGSTFPFQLWVETVIQSKAAIFKFPNVVSGKLGLDFKAGDFNPISIDFECYADGEGNSSYLYFN